jgi:cysteinyl-tRNA synthetase
VKEAKSALNGFYDLFARLREQGQAAAGDAQLASAIERCEGAFRAAMDDDFNTPVVIAAFQGLRGDVNKLLMNGLSDAARRQARAAFASLGGVLGLFAPEVDEVWKFGDKSVPLTGVEASVVGGSVSVDQLSDEEIQRLLTERLAARKRRDIATADQIRASLASQGINKYDKPDGTSRWKR